MEKGCKMNNNLLTQNTKMKKSSKNGLVVVNWTIPAFISKSGLKTCPNARACVKGCYARSGTYSFSNVKSAHEAKLDAALAASFESNMIASIESWLSKRSVKTLKIRIHDAGDFYSQEYLDKWIAIMRHYFETSPRVSFYAYTKMVRLIKQQTALPSNFTVIYSFGGSEDSFIDTSIDRHAKVFESQEDLINAGYTDGTEDDTVAALGLTRCIGLVYHGAKNYENTDWKRAA
jgi:Gene product 88